MRVVVIGHGMVGSRFAADLLAALPQTQLTILGQEDHDPYNRVQLSSVVAGKKDPTTLALDQADPERARILRGVAAVSIDRERREVLDARGEVHPYDRLVLATGSAARIPQISWLRSRLGTLVDGVTALKEMDDAYRILGAVAPDRRAVVLGAGVLGLEVATGLVARGMEVSLVHHRDRLMERQLDPEASEILVGALERLGIAVVTGVNAVRATSHEDRLTGLELSDGTYCPADLLVLCAGTTPNVALAAEAGLDCAHGILVGDDLAAPSDPAIFAIGDCAQPPDGASGLVAQGWDQARRLVDAWTAQARHREAIARGETPAAPTTASAPVDRRTQGDLVRVKSVGFAMVTMGRIDRPGPSAHAPRSVRLADPDGGRYTEVVVRDGLLLAATVIGDDDVAAELSSAFTRRTPVPRDPIHLVARPLPASSAATAPTRSVLEMDDEEIVCQCNGVSKGAICTAVHEGADGADGVAAATRAGTGCGTCRSQIAELCGALAAQPQPA
ncbi:FAD-dependent oxidoreductase [Brachybacterium sp. DNPG3]